MDAIQICVLLIIVLHCNGLSIFDHLGNTQRLIRRRSGSPYKPKIMRRVSLPGSPSVILGAPLYSYHLPSAEPILPGHTLIRPAIGMLKSAVKFPHREQENGFGVYGHIDNLGIKYDGKNDRVLYTGFRRMLPQSDHSPERRSAYNNPYWYRRRHLEVMPPRPKKRKKLNQYTDSNFKKLLTIYPSQITNKKHKLKGQRPQAPNRFRNTWSLRHSNEIEPQDIVLGQVILIRKEEDTGLLDLFRIIKSLRRDEELEDEEKPNQLYVPGTAVFGDFGLAESDSENTPINKTTMFWKTKNAFNHVKISPEAPEHRELVPADAAEKQRNWWFYHQCDFENFEGN